MQYTQIESNDWSTILKLQDQYSKQQDEKRKQQQKMHKLLLKHQLEAMIRQKQIRNKQYSMQDPKILQYNSEKIKTIEAQQYEQKQKLQNMRLNFSRDNYYHSLESKIKLKQQNIRQKTLYSERFKKLSTELCEEKQRSKRTYSLKQHQLALAYDQQLQQQNKRRILQKNQGIKYQNLAKHIQDQRQKQRADVLNKIRYGYSQNLSVFNAHNQVQQKRQRQRQNLIDSIANSQRSIILGANDLKDTQKEKYRLRKQASKFNRQQFQQKQFRKRMFNLKQTIEDQQKFDTISQFLQEQKRIKSIQKQKQRKLLQFQLERQIKQAQQQKRNSKFMNPQEFKINNSILNKDRIQTGSFPPGVSYDYKIDKQKMLIQRFLGGQSKRQSSPSFFESLK